MTQPKPALNKRVILVTRPVGIAQASDFAIEETALPPLEDGEVCVANQVLSVDPAMRGWIADSGNYSDPVTQQQGKALMRMLINHHLGAQPLHTRRLLQDLQSS